MPRSKCAKRCWFSLGLGLGIRRQLSGMRDQITAKRSNHRISIFFRFNDVVKGISSLDTLVRCIYLFIWSRTIEISHIACFVRVIQHLKLNNYFSFFPRNKWHTLLNYFGSVFHLLMSEHRLFTFSYDNMVWTSHRFPQVAAILSRYTNFKSK